MDGGDKKGYEITRFGRNDGGWQICLEEKDPCTGSNINVLSVLVHIADPILLGLRLVGLVWFGLVMGAVSYYHNRGKWDNFQNLF